MTDDQAAQLLQQQAAIYEALRWLLYVAEVGLFFTVLYIAYRLAKGKA